MSACWLLAIARGLAWWSAVCDLFDGCCSDFDEDGGEEKKKEELEVVEGDSCIVELECKATGLQVIQASDDE